MKAKGKFISFLLVVDTFFVAYAYGFHSRQVLVVDPKLPPVVQKKGTDKIEEKDSAGKAITTGKAAAKPLSKHESKKHELKKLSANNDKSAKEQLAKKEKPVTAGKQGKAVAAKNKASAVNSTNQAKKKVEKQSP